MYVYRCTRALMRSKAFSTCTSPRTSVRQRHQHTAQSTHTAQSIQSAHPPSCNPVNPSSQSTHPLSQSIPPVNPSRQSQPASQSTHPPSGNPYCPLAIYPVNMSSQSTHPDSQSLIYTYMMIRPVNRSPSQPIRPVANHPPSQSFLPVDPPLQSTHPPLLAL